MVFKVRTYPLVYIYIRFWTQIFLFVMRFRKAGLSFVIRARKRELCLQRYVYREWLEPKIFKSKLFKVFLEHRNYTIFVHVSCCHNDYYEPKILCPNLVRKVIKLLSVYVRQCPFESVQVRQCPSMSA